MPPCCHISVLGITHHTVLVNMSNSECDGDMPIPDGCVHPFQCPNPLCQRVFTTRHGLSMHFYHQQNVFCNPPNQFCTVGEELATPSVLPTRMDPADDIDEDSEHQFDDFSDPVWSDSEDVSSSKTPHDRPPPLWCLLILKKTLGLHLMFIQCTKHSVYPTPLPMPLKLS